MGAWLTVISGFFQLLYLIISNKFEKDKAEQARKDLLHAEAKEAIASGDKSRITTIFDKLYS